MSKDKSKTKEIVELTKKLIKFRSVSSDDKELRKCADFVFGYFADYEFEIKRYLKNGKPSVVVKFPGVEAPRVFLNGHFDVVPGSDGQFKPFVEEDRLVGRGALDMKSQVAAMMVLMKDLGLTEKSFSLGLMLVGDEEIGGFDGTLSLIKDEGCKCDFVIAGEPTAFNIGYAAKGILRIKFISKGKSAHAARPWLGENANTKLVKVLNDFLSKNPVPSDRTSDTTYNFATIDGGDVINKVPDKCEAITDVRYSPEDSAEDIISRVRKLYGQEVTIETPFVEPSAFCDKDNEYLIKLKEIIEGEVDDKPNLIVKNGGSDVRHFTSNGIPGVVFGPSGGKSAHTDNEWVSVSEIKKFYDILRKFVSEVC